MAESERDSSVEEPIRRSATDFGQSVLGRTPTPDEATALNTILQATARALKHGFINRLAEQVQAESENETVEEFFENIKSD